MLQIFQFNQNIKILFLYQVYYTFWVIFLLPLKSKYVNFGKCLIIKGKQFLSNLLLHNLNFVKLLNPYKLSNAYRLQSLNSNETFMIIIYNIPISGYLESNFAISTVNSSILIFSKHSFYILS